MVEIGRQVRNKLERFVVSGLEDTGQVLGAGSYGEVVKMRLNGETVAVKKIHRALINVDNEGWEASLMKFEEECIRYAAYILIPTYM